MLSIDYFVKLERIFRKGYERSLKYSEEKKKLLKYFKKSLEIINSKLKGSELGSNIPEFLANIKRNPSFANYTLFVSNTNLYLKRRLFKRKLSEDELNFLWILHSNDVKRVRNHRLARLLVLLQAESIFINNSYRFIASLILKLNSEQIQNKNVRDFIVLMTTINPLLTRLSEIIKEQIQSLQQGEVQQFLSKLDEEEQLKENIYKILISFFQQHQNIGKYVIAIRKLNVILRSGIVGLCLTISIFSNVIAGEITRAALKNIFMAEFIEEVVKDVNIEINFTWEEDIQLAEGITKKSAEELVSEAIKYTFRFYKTGKPKPKSVNVMLGLGKFKEEGKENDAVYDVVDNQIYINPSTLSLYLHKDVRAYLFFDNIIHETVHLLDHNMNPNATKNNWAVA